MFGQLGRILKGQTTAREQEFKSATAKVTAALRKQTDQAEELALASTRDKLLRDRLTLLEDEVKSLRKRNFVVAADTASLVEWNAPAKFPRLITTGQLFVAGPTFPHGA